MSRRMHASLCSLLVALVTTGCVSNPAVPASAPSIELRARSLSAATDRYFTSADASIRYRDAGQGTPIVFVHGLSRSLDDWMPVADGLAPNYRVIALDVRAHGKSTDFRDPAKLGPQMTEDVVRLLEHLGIENAYIAGHSMGALIAADAAMRHPGRVKGVILVAGGFSPQRGTWQQDPMGFVADLEQGRGMSKLIEWLFPWLPDSAVKQMNDESMRANDPGVMVAAMRSMDAFTVHPSSGTPSIPAVVIVGTKDPLRDASKWLTSWWPNARLVEVEGGDHVSVMYGEEFRAAVRQLVR